MDGQLRVGIVGASGHAGGEICRLLLGHRRVSAIVPSSRGNEGFERLHPNLLGCGLAFTTPSALDDQARDLDVVFFCAPSGEAMLQAQHFLDAGSRVIDLGPDFRFPSPEAYEAVYGRSHASPHLLEKAVYGVTEINRRAIRHARLVANPGCYAITAILGLAPVLAGGFADLSKPVHVVAVNGTTGAGSSRDTSHASVTGGMLFYSLEGHRHGPELEERLSELAGDHVDVVFSTAHGPFARGIHATITVTAHPDCAQRLSRDLLIEAYLKHFGSGLDGERFVVINSSPRNGKRNDKEYHLYPNVARVAGSNYCQIGLDYDPDRHQIKIAAVTDNLVKGAAGSAIQNMNVMLGIAEEEGLCAFGL